MFPRALRILRVGGVDVRIDPSWLVIALLVAWSFLARFDSATRATALAATMAVAATVLFFASVLVHEVAHALEGRHRALEVHGVTLFLFGGVTEMRADSERPRDEFAVAAVGPYASLVCAAVFGLLATLAARVEVPGMAPVAEVAGILGWLNVFLAVFNLVPGAPLDGGRVLRAGLWAVTRDRQRAVRWSARAGQALGLVLVVLAVRVVLLEPGAVFQALWLGVIGAFLWQAARGERRQAELELLLAGHTARTLVSASPHPVPAGASVADAAERMMGHPAADVVPVADADGRVVGVLEVGDVTAVPSGERATTTAADVARELDGMPEVGADAALTEVVRLAATAAAVVIRSSEDDVAVVGQRQVDTLIERLRTFSGHRTGAPRRSRRDRAQTKGPA